MLERPLQTPMENYMQRQQQQILIVYTLPKASDVLSLRSRDIKTFTSIYQQEMLRYSAAICRFDHGIKRYILLSQTMLREAKQYVSCMVGNSE
jgi:hypothetical protein